MYDMYIYVYIYGLKNTHDLFKITSISLKVKYFKEKK